MRPVQDRRRSRHRKRLGRSSKAGSPLRPAKRPGSRTWLEGESAIASQSQRVDDPLTNFEAGVFAGQSMAVWYDTARQEGVGTRCFGADSFQGLPSSVADDEGGWRPGQFACPRPVTEWNLQRLGIPLEDVTLIEGWFDETLTPALAEDVGVVHVAMLDADAFSSTETVLNFVGPILDDEAWLVFDDWFTGGNVDEATGGSLGTGVERAFDEWMARNPGWSYDIVDDYELERDGRTRKAGRVLRLTRAQEVSR
ncbi:MAG: TylF/MycF/NovP-related O-methyltransferase [Acidimicrobiales bacterium]